MQWWHLELITFKQLQSREPAYCCARVPALRWLGDQIAQLNKKMLYATTFI